MLKIFKYPSAYANSGYLFDYLSYIPYQLSFLQAMPACLLACGRITALTCYQLCVTWFLLPDTCYLILVTRYLLPNTFVHLFCKSSFLIIVTSYLLHAICCLILVSWHIIWLMTYVTWNLLPGTCYQLLFAKLSPSPNPVGLTSIIFTRPSISCGATSLNIQLG